MEPLFPLLTFDLDVYELWMHAQGQVGGECPGGGGPCDDAGRGVVIQGEIDNHCTQATKQSQWFDRASKQLEQVVDLHMLLLGEAPAGSCTSL